MAYRMLLALLVAGTMSGCATNSTRSNTERDLEQGKYEAAYRHAEYSITHNGKNAADYINMFRNEYPQSLPAITAYYRDEIEHSTDELEFLTIPENLAAAHMSHLVTDADFQSLTQLLGEVAVQRVHDGSLPIEVTDNYQAIPALTAPAIEEVIFRNSVDKLISTGSEPLAEAIFKLAREKGTNSPEYRYLANHIMQIHLSKEMLKGDFSALFPNEAQERMQRTQVKIKLVARSEDDEDYVYGVSEYLEQNKQVDITKAVDPDTYVVTLHKLRFREHELSERTETVRYAQHEVNMAGAVLLMPRNATYTYDVTTGGFSINYVFDVKLTRAGNELIQHKIEGKREEKYSYFSDAKIQNVFGGISPAGFVANADMQNRCSKNTHSVNEEAVYNKVLEGIATQILSLQPIKNRLDYGVL